VSVLRRLKLGLIIVPLAILAWVVVAVVLGSGTFSGARSAVGPSGPSPVCLPATLDHSAALAGTTVNVSPAPETDTANPHTQISFLGTPVTDIQDVSVVGSHSGYHYGHLYGYFQGDGGSFVPDEPFKEGERVAVNAVLQGAGGGTKVSFSFHIATPYPTESIPEFPNPPAPPSSYQSFVSAPDIHPPIMAVTVPDRDPISGDILTTVGPGPGQFGPLIYTPQGRVVWFQPLADGNAAENLSQQSYEGERDLTWWQGRVLSLGFGEGEDIVMNDDYQTVARVRAGNGFKADLHDFQLAPNQIAYITVYNPMRCDLTPVDGPRNGTIVDTAVQEVDVKTGLVRWEWHSLDHVGVSESHATVPAKDKPVPWDYFHLNSIDAEPSGNLLISGRSTWAAYQLQRGSGLIQWRLGGTQSSFAMGPGAETAWQHDARMLPDGSVTFFDDGSNPRIHYQSRGVRVALDLSHRRASLVKVDTHPSALLADSQGNNQTLPDEDSVIGWGAVPEISEFARDGSLLFDAHLPPGMSSYRAFRFPWSGHPLSAPAVSARVLTTGDSTALFASWNGATDVASWRVLATTEDPDSLKPVETMPDSGFESSVTLPEKYSYVSVQALDAAGQLLGTSNTVAVTPPPAAPPAG
jgi:Arylsulfotransferase (ASST)